MFWHIHPSQHVRTYPWWPFFVKFFLKISLIILTKQFSNNCISKKLNKSKYDTWLICWLEQIFFLSAITSIELYIQTYVSTHTQICNYVHIPTHWQIYTSLQTLYKNNFMKPKYHVVFCIENILKIYFLVCYKILWVLHKVKIKKCKL